MARGYATAMLDMWEGSFGAATDTLIAPRPAPAAATTTISREGKEVSIYIRGTTILPKWFETARNALNTIAALPSGWNSYSSREIHPDAVASAVQILLEIMGEDTALPTFVPVPNGGILLEWHTQTADLEIEVMTNGRVRADLDKVGAPPAEVEGLPQELAAELKALLLQI